MKSRKRIARYALPPKKPLTAPFVFRRSPMIRNPRLRLKLTSPETSDFLSINVVTNGERGSCRVCNCDKLVTKWF